MKGSSASLRKYGIAFDGGQTDNQLRATLSQFYAQRNLSKTNVDPSDCAEAILCLASARARCTTGHIVPVDGGLSEGFLR